MKSHILILTSPKLNIPETDRIQFVKDLIISNLVNVDYFGGESDNESDYINREITDKDANTTFLIFHFKENDIDYNNYKEEALFQLVYDKLASKNIQVITTEKDIEFYIQNPLP